MATLSFFKDLFDNKLLDDDREPFLQFQIPGLDGEFAILAPRLELWLQLVYVRVMHDSTFSLSFPCAFILTIFLFPI